VQYPLSLVSVKYKHFLMFGLGGPILNTLIWFATRIADHKAPTAMFQWEDEVDEVGCMFTERKMVDRWVMEVPILIILFFNTFFLVWIIFVSSNARAAN
jgi:hypothetical protein